MNICLLNSKCIEKSGLLEIKDKVQLSNGCYQFKWSGQSAEFKSSTFFPSDWTRAQTIEKISESMMPSNTKMIKYMGKEKYRVLGLTPEGVPVTSVIRVGNTSAQVISAYPDFITYKKFLNGEL